MPLSLNEMCYLRITGNVNSEKLPGKGEYHDHQYLWRGASANFHIIPANSSRVLHFYSQKTQGGV